MSINLYRRLSGRNLSLVIGAMNKKQTPVIAIDGPAASGKGTLARNIAAELGFAHLDTGLLYREVGFIYCENLAWTTPERSLELAVEVAASYPGREWNPEYGFTPVDADVLKNYSEEASIVAAVPEVRKSLNILQKQFAASPP